MPDCCLRCPDRKRFECLPEVPAEARVLFQTRVWPPSGDEAEWNALNDERAELVRALRKAFGDQFMGGVIPTDYARQHYPDVVTDLPFSMRAYPRLVRQPLVGVYTRGLGNSVAFKPSESLAASRCIRRTQDRFASAQSAARTNFLAFESPKECIAQCGRLPTDGRTASAMRQVNWSYYRAHVEPISHMLGILDLVLERQP